MIKIIDGLRYDTETAIEIGSYDHGCYPGSGDFSHWSATLYKTPRSGRFFVYGEGGAMTQFAHSCSDGRSSCGGKNLIPLSSEEAQEWAESYLDAEDIEQHFTVEDA